MMGEFVWVRNIMKINSNEIMSIKKRRITYLGSFWAGKQEIVFFPFFRGNDQRAESLQRFFERFRFDSGA